MCPNCQQTFSLQRQESSSASVPGAAAMPTVEPDRIVMHATGPALQCTCPFCSTALSATTRGLRQSGGLMACGRCQQQFNVLVPTAGLSAGSQRISRSELLQLITMMASSQPSTRTPSASQSQIEVLPTRTVVVKPQPAEEGNVEEDERVTCMICLSEKEVGDTLRTLPCMHDFHCECIDEWLKTNRTCPICKTDITTGIADASIENDGRLRA